LLENARANNAAQESKSFLFQRLTNPLVPRLSAIAFQSIAPSFDTTTGTHATTPLNPGKSE